MSNNLKSVYLLVQNKQYNHTHTTLAIKTSNRNGKTITEATSTKKDLKATNESETDHMAKIYIILDNSFLVVEFVWSYKVCCTRYRVLYQITLVLNKSSIQRSTSKVDLFTIVFKLCFSTLASCLHGICL